MATTTIDPMAERRKEEEAKRRAAEAAQKEAEEKQRLAREQKKLEVKKQSEAAELVRRETAEANKKKAQKEKDRARIDLNVEEGLLRSTQREIDHMKAELRSFQSNLAQIKFAEENDVRLERGIDLKVQQEEAMKSVMVTEKTRKHSTIETRKQTKVQEEAKIAALQAELKIMLQELERKQRILKNLEGDTTIDTEAKKAESEEQSIQQRIAASEAREQKLEQEKLQLKADEQKREKEYQEMERKFRDVELKVRQLEANAQEYNTVVATLRRKVR